MRRILALAAWLLILVTALAGCQERPKDQLPTEPLPKEQPQPVGGAERP